MRQFKRVIHLFGEFEFLWSKMTCLDEEIKRKLKLRNFKKVFQITKIVEFEIPPFVEFLIVQDEKKVEVNLADNRPRLTESNLVIFWLVRT